MRSHRSNPSGTGRRTRRPAAVACWLIGAAAVPGQDTSLVRTNTSDGQTVASTVTNGAGIALGNPRTIRWSIAKDGAQLPTAYYAGSDPARPSLLIADLDNDFGVAAGDRGADLTTRPWFASFSTMLDRIANKTGLSFVYEPSDDGAAVGADGSAGVRGDLRIAGGPLTAALGYNGIPTGGTQPDMVMNTSRAWNSTDLRFVSMHEYHHGLGFGHVQVENNGNASAVAPSGGNSNGPQFHDLIQLHRKYGDPYEKGSRNESRANATNLGGFGFWSAKTVGSDWDDLWIGADQTDFTTISASNDADFFKLDTTGPMVVRAKLTPKGPVYDYTTEGQGAATVDSSKFMNLRLDAQDSGGGTVASAAAQPAGIAEELPELFLPSAGTWYFRVGIDGSSTSPQAYRLEISDPAMPTGLVAGFNTAGNFEGWTAFNSVNTRTVSGGALNGTISGSDPQVRREDFGFAGSSVPNVLVRVKSSVTGSFQLFWGRSGADNYDAARSLTLNIPQANTWTVLSFSPAGHAQWAGQTITRIRLDPPGGSGATFNIDFIVGPDNGATMAWQSGAEAGGSGSWDASNTNWQLAGNTMNWLPGSRALFRGTAGTVTLAADTSAAALDFQTAGYVLGGSATLNLSAGAEIGTTSGTATVSCPVTGTTVVKTGGGTLLLGGAPPVLTTMEAQAGKVTFQPPADATFAAALAGAASVSKEGASVLTLSGANSFTGAVTIGAGALRLTTSSSLGSGAKTVTMTNGTAGKCRIILAGGDTPVVLPTTMSFRSSNNDPALPAVLNESGDNTIQGNFTMTSGGGGTRFSSQGGSLTLAGTMTPDTSGRVVHLDGAGNGTVSGVIRDQNTTNILALDKTGTGSWTLSGANTYTGATNVAAGTLAVNGSLASAVTVQAGGTLSGTGTVAAASASNAGGTATLAPGHGGVGKLTVAGSAVLGQNARYVWEVRDWTGAAGTGADLLEANGLVIAATPARPLVIAVVPNQLGSFQDASRTFVIARGTSTMSGFDPAAVRVDASAFTAASGSWSVRQTGTALELAYAPPTYQEWAASNGLTGSAALADADPDADGLENGIEFVVGGQPNPARPGASSRALAPSAVLTSTHLVFTYRRTDTAFAHPGIGIVAQYGNALTGWTQAANASGGVSITVTDDGFGKGVDRVDVSIPRSLGAGGRLFARLRVIMP